MELHVFNIRTQMYRRGSNGFITEKTILFVQTPCPPMDPHKKHRGSNTDRNRSLNMRTDWWNLQTCAFTGRQTEKNIHVHVKTDRQTYRNINIHVLTDRQAVGQTEKYIRVKYDNELKFNWWRTMQFHCIGHNVRLAKMCYETVGIIIDLLWP